MAKAPCFKKPLLTPLLQKKKKKKEEAYGKETSLDFS